jgi:hypothetical protein
MNDVKHASECNFLLFSHEYNIHFFCLPLIFELRRSPVYVSTSITSLAVFSRASLLLCVILTFMRKQIFIDQNLL